MYRWATCPASVRLSAGIESRSSKYAEEGTAAHDLAAKILLDPNTDVSTVDPEMLLAVRVYVNAVLETPGEKKLIEHRFDLSSIHPGLFGTCDAIIFDERNKTLRVYDYKHGAGIPVEVVEDGEPNSQLAYYGLGALLSTGFLAEFVELVIVQPRCPHPDGPIRRHSFPSFELLDFAADLKEAALKTEDENAPIIPGDHCRFCPANAICPGVKNKAQILAKMAFSPVEPVAGGAVTPYDPAKLSEALEWLPVLEAWVRNVRDFAYSEATSGKVIPGWKLVEKRKTRKWADENRAAEFLSKEFPSSVELLFERSLKSPAQIEKVLHKKQHEKFESLIVSQSSGTTLVPATDARPEVKVMELKKTEFERLAQEADLFE